MTLSKVAGDLQKIGDKKVRAWITWFGNLSEKFAEIVGWVSNSLILVGTHLFFGGGNQWFWATAKWKTPLNYLTQVIQAVTFSSPIVGGHQQALKRVTNHHPKKVTFTELPGTSLPFIYVNIPYRNGYLEGHLTQIFLSPTGWTNTGYRGRSVTRRERRAGRENCQCVSREAAARCFMVRLHRCKSSNYFSKGNVCVHTWNPLMTLVLLEVWALLWRANNPQNRGLLQVPGIYIFISYQIISIWII